MISFCFIFSINLFFRVVIYSWSSINSFGILDIKLSAAGIYICGIVVISIDFPSKFSKICVFYTALMKENLSLMGNYNFDIRFQFSSRAIC